MNQQAFDQVQQAISNVSPPGRRLLTATEVRDVENARRRVAAKNADAFPAHFAQLATAYRISLARAGSSGLVKLSWGQQLQGVDKLLAESRSLVPPVPEVTCRYGVGMTKHRMNEQPHRRKP